MCASLTEVFSRNSPICVDCLLFSADSSRKINHLRINLTFNQERGNTRTKSEHGHFPQNSPNDSLQQSIRTTAASHHTLATKIIPGREDNRACRGMWGLRQAWHRGDRCCARGRSCMRRAARVRGRSGDGDAFRYLLCPRGHNMFAQPILPLCEWALFRLPRRENGIHR